MSTAASSYSSSPTAVAASSPLAAAAASSASTANRFSDNQLCLLLDQFLSVENEIRQRAESVFNDWKQGNPDELIRGLTMVLLSHQDQKLRQQAAVAIRNVLRDFLLHRSDSQLWTLLSNDTKQALKVGLLNVLDRETAKPVRKSVCDTVSDLAGELAANGEWPELNPKLMDLVQSPHPACQASGLKILGDLVPQLSELIRSNTAGVVAVIMNAIKSENSDVRYECLCLIVSLIQGEPRSVWKHVQSAIPDIIAGFQTLAGNESMQEMAVEYLAKLVEIADSCSSFYRPHLPQLVHALLTVGRDSMIESEVRHMAVEVLLCIVEDKPRMCLKLPNFTSQLICILLQFMLTIETDSEWLDSEEPETPTSPEGAAGADVTRDYDVGETGLDRVAAAMGGDSVMSVVFGYVSQYLRKEEWQYKLVAIMAISQTAEYLPEENLDTYLADIVNILMLQMNDENHRVRFAVCQAIGQIALDHQPLFQNHYAEVVLPALLRVLDDPVPRVQSHAAAALINFAEEVEKADLLPFVNPLMDKLFERIGADKPRIIREQCVTGIAVIAGVLEKSFLNYYSIIVPAIKSIITNSLRKEERTLRGKGIECISLIGLSVGAEAFRNDAHDVMQSLLKAIGASSSDSEDPMKEYIQEALCRLCKTMKADFVIYLPHLMPDILKALNVKPEIVDDDDATNEDELEDMTIVSLADGKYTGLKTSVINEMTDAAELVTRFIETLGAAFGEFLQPTAQSLLPLLAFPLSDDVKRSALGALAEIFAATRELISTATTNDPSAQNTLSSWVADVLQKVFKELTPGDEEAGNTEIELMVAETSGLAKCLRSAGPAVLTAQQVAAVCDKVFQLMRESSQRRSEIAAKKVDPDFDEEDVGRLEEEETLQQTLRSSLLEIIGAIMSFHQDLFLQTGADLCGKFIETHLQSTCSVDDVALALYIADDVLENLQNNGSSLWPSFSSRLVESLSVADPGVRQAAAYGIIQACKCSQFPSSLLQDAAARLVAILNEANANDKSFLSATDNAIAALGALILNRSEVLLPSPEQYLNLWINSLPLKSDDEEGRRVHKQLLNLLVKKNPDILGLNNCNVPKLVSICAAIYHTDFSTAAIDEGIREFIKAVGFDNISSMASNFDKPIRRGLEKIHRDSTAAVQQQQQAPQQQIPAAQQQQQQQQQQLNQQF